MEVACTQCGAAIQVGADARLIECPFCATSLVVDGSGTLFHEVMVPIVNADEVAAHLRRFLGGDATVAGLDEQAQIGEPRLEFFPFWAFTARVAGGERIVLQPAAPSSLQGLQGLELPGGTARPMGSGMTLGASVVDPEVPQETAREWLTARFAQAEVTRTVLYHLPLYRVSYTFKGTTYNAAVEGVSGKVLPADYPSKAEAPYLGVTALALVVFGLEGLIIQSIPLKLIVYLVSAVPILGIAWLTSKKV
ncbi:MAG: hypothetical protein ACC742_02465 [Thermoanaerobaculales bacterium]